MSRLGISIYPENATVQQNKDYIKLAADNGFKRIFTCLLSAKGSIDEVKKEYRELCVYAKSFGMEVIIDVAPSVFEKFGIKYDDLSFFNDICADGIRLDEGFNGQMESVMTYNPYNLKIEFNASQLTGYIDNIMSYQPNKSNMITCHNFYPQKYTGIGLDLFNKCNETIKNKNLNVAAFVSSQTKNTFGPWPVNEGLCTLEMHRNLPIDVQARHLFATNMIDDVIIANCFASEQEMIQLGEIDPNKLTFKISEETKLTDVENEIVYDYSHHVRGDMSEYMARSTFSRVTYAKATIVPNNTVEVLERGDVVVLNDNYGPYKGELHIVLKQMPNEGNKNLVGRINKNELFLLDYIVPWIPFKIIK